MFLLVPRFGKIERRLRVPKSRGDDHTVPDGELMGARVMFPVQKVVRRNDLERYE